MGTHHSIDRGRICDLRIYCPNWVRHRCPKSADECHYKHGEEAAISECYDLRYSEEGCTNKDCVFVHNRVCLDWRQTAVCSDFAFVDGCRFEHPREERGIECLSIKDDLRSDCRDWLTGTCSLDRLDCDGKVSCCALNGVSVCGDFCDCPIMMHKNLNQTWSCASKYLLCFCVAVFLCVLAARPNRSSRRQVTLLPNLAAGTMSAA